MDNKRFKQIQSLGVTASEATEYAQRISGVTPLTLVYYNEERNEFTLIAQYCSREGERLVGILLEDKGPKMLCLEAFTASDADKIKQPIVPIRISEYIETKFSFLEKPHLPLKEEIWRIKKDQSLQEKLASTLDVLRDNNVPLPNLDDPVWMHPEGGIELATNARMTTGSFLKSGRRENGTANILVFADIPQEAFDRWKRQR